MVHVKIAQSSPEHRVMESNADLINVNKDRSCWLMEAVNNVIIIREHRIMAMIVDRINAMRSRSFLSMVHASLVPHMRGHKATAGNVVLINVS